MTRRRYKKHRKTYYEELGAPYDRGTVLKVGDTVFVKSKDFGTVVKMTRSVCTWYGFIDWYIKVKLVDGTYIWTCGPSKLTLVKAIEGGPRIRRRSKLR